MRKSKLKEEERPRERLPSGSAELEISSAADRSIAKKKWQGLRAKKERGKSRAPRRASLHTAWSSLLANGVRGSTPEERSEAVEAAAALRKLADYDGNLEDAVMLIGVAKDKFYRWLTSGRFADKLLTCAPMLSAKCLADVCAMADGAEGGNEVRLKANMELIRAFMPIVSKEIDFDSNTRKQKIANQGYLAGKVLTMRDQLAIMAKDPFVDYSDEIRKLKQTPIEIGMEGEESNGGVEPTEQVK